MKPRGGGSSLCPWAVVFGLLALQLAACGGDERASLAGRYRKHMSPEFEERLPGAEVWKKRRRPAPDRPYVVVLHIGIDGTFERGSQYIDTATWRTEESRRSDGRWSVAGNHVVLKYDKFHGLSPEVLGQGAKQRLRIDGPRLWHGDGVWYERMDDE